MSFAPPPRPYPPERYTGSTGENSATYRPADHPHELTNAAGYADYLATGDRTGGDFGLYRWHMAGPPGGPGPHFHKTLSESFFVIDGTIQIYNGTDWLDGRPGDFVFVPPGGVHGFRNASGEPATMLILFAPGAPRERYFEGLVERASMSTPPTADELAEFYLAHDNYWLD
jgi:mannose-6-phosphate isomerase-like protein (cupin superfamily)